MDLTLWEADTSVMKTIACKHRIYGVKRKGVDLKMLNAILLQRYILLQS